jgi:N6-adenosine-specific RNA methylase IME4
MTLDVENLIAGGKFSTILADPPWLFQNSTGKVAPEHRRLHRYSTMTLEQIMALPVAQLAAEPLHLYLWCPNALLPEGLAAVQAWGFIYKSNIVWHKIRKDGGPDGRGVGFYFRNVTELVLFGVRGKNARTLTPGRRQVNFLATQKREHSRKPDELYPIIEACSPGPYLELFARSQRPDWCAWGDEAPASADVGKSADPVSRVSAYVTLLRTGMDHEKDSGVGNCLAAGQSCWLSREQATHKQSKSAVAQCGRQAVFRTIRSELSDQTQTQHGALISSVP